MNVLWEIYITFFKIGAFSFGGGNAVLGLIQDEIVTSKNWISVNDFLDIVAIAQITPGPIAVNAATFTGYKVASVSGAIAGSLGIVTPSFILIIIAAKFYSKVQDKPATKAIFKGIKPAVVAMVFSAGISISKSALIDAKTVAVFLTSVVLLWKFDVSPFIVLFGFAIIGILFF